MTPNCIQAVQQAAGRVLTPAQIKAIDDRMVATMRRLAVKDPQTWRAMPRDDRVLAAATQAMQDIADEAARKVANAQRQIVKTAETNNRVATQRQAWGTSHTGALVHDMENSGAYIDGVKNDYVRELADLIEAGSDGTGAGIGRRAMMALFDADNPAMSRALAIEIFGNAKGSTGNTVAAKAAKAWLDTIEGMRQRFNAAGGDVRRLDYGYLPQPHEQARVLAAAGPAKDGTPWAQKLLPKLDRKRYLNEDGTPMSDAQVMDVLRAAWHTISSDGLNKLTPGQFKGNGARANAGSDSRQIHFKDADAYLDYMAEFGRGSMYDAMVGHIGGLARDIGLVERYGPNPEQQMRVQIDQAGKADGAFKRVFGLPVESYWSVMSGAAGTPQSPRWAMIGRDLRNIQTAAKLGGAVISSVTDLGSFFVTLRYNNLPYWQAIGNLRQGKATREFLAGHGIIADSIVSDLNRWSGDHLGHNWSGRLANSTMKLSLMNAWTDSLRNAFQMTMMSGLGRLTRTDWPALTQYDRLLMERHGITPADWSVMRSAALVQHRGQDFLTPDAIYATGHARAQEVAAKMLGLIKDEGEFAIINPDLATQAIQSWGGNQAGTGVGELARAVMQFKSFPIAMISRHWRRMMDMPAVPGAPFNRLAYGAAMAVSLTMMGAVAFQVKQMLAGKDPVGMDTPKFWARAALQGGAMGILGDLLLADPSEAPGDAAANAVKNIAGPAPGAAFELLFKVGAENAHEAIAGKETHAAAEAMRFLKSNTPLVNLWYTRAAIDHAVLQQLQENASPGYLNRMRSRARKEWGQDYWWAPGEAVPERAPNFGAAVGQ
jgi:hypothetical protein